MPCDHGCKSTSPVRRYRLPVSAGPSLLERTVMELQDTVAELSRRVAALEAWSVEISNHGGCVTYVGEDGVRVGPVLTGQHFHNRLAKLEAPR